MTKVRRRCRTTPAGGGASAGADGDAVADGESATRTILRSLARGTYNPMNRPIINGRDDGKIVFAPTFQKLLAKRGFLPGAKPE